MSFRALSMSMGLCLSAVLICLPAFAGPNMNPGKWEITTETKIKGMAGMSIPAQTHAQCITEEDLVPMDDKASNECEVTDIRTRGNTVSWKIVCTGEEGRMEGSGETTYSGDAMEGTMHMNMVDADMQVTNLITGRRIGSCDGKATGASQPSKPSAVRSPGEDGGNNAVGEAVAEDAKEIGEAGRDEIKQSSIEEVREGVRSVFKSLFD